MKAMILAAGLGTRLRPLTDERPKALIPVANEPAILRNIEYLKAHGVTDIIINAHHHYRQVLDFFAHWESTGPDIQIRVEPEILGTGGGIRNTEDFWDDAPFFVINSDILTNVDLEKALDRHLNSGALATLVLHDHPPYNKIRTDAEGRITEIPRTYDCRGLAFTGIHVIHPLLLKRIPKNGFSDIIDCYRELIRSGEPVNSYVVRGHSWHDIGSVMTYVTANRDLAPKRFLIGKDTLKYPSSRLEEWVIIGDHCRLEEAAVVRRSILWEGVTVGREAEITDSIVTPAQTVSFSLG